MIRVESNLDELTVLFNKQFTLKNTVISDLTEIIRSDIQSNLELGRSFDGSSIMPKKNGGRIFYETGELMNSVLKTTTKDIGEVFIGSNRSQIAEYLHYGTSNMVNRRFFGVSERINTGIDNYINSKTIDELFE